MSQHTPGPWNVSLIADTLYVGNSEVYVGRAFRCHPLAEVESHANARLIAASPDLLAACKAANAAIVRMAEHGQMSPDDFCEVQRLTSAAIAKTEGRRA